MYKLSARTLLHLPVIWETLFKRIVQLAGMHLLDFIISSAENQKDIITIQGCSVENQKGAIAIQSVWW